MNKILILFLMVVAQSWGIIAQLDTENADRNITSTITVLTDTPDASNPMLCQGLVYFGDGAKDLSGAGGNFELTITVGGQTIQPSPQVITFGTEIRSSVWTSQFPVPANAEVVLMVKSPNGADTDVDVTAYLYNVATADMIAISGDTTAADNLEAMYDGTGYNDDNAPATQLQVSTLVGGIAVPTIATGITISEPGGGEQTLTYVATASHDGVYHEVASDDDGDDIDFYYTFNTGSGDNSPVDFHFHGYYEDNNPPANSTMVIQSYNFNIADWETIATLTDSASVVSLDLPLHTHDVDPDGGGEGDVRIRFNLTTPEISQNIRIDHVTIGYVSGGLTVSAIVDGTWNALLTGATYSIPTSAGRRLREFASMVIVSGTSPNTGGTANTLIRIELDNDASSVSSSYDPANVCIIKGTGVGQSRQIWEYNGTNKYAYINRDWKTIPDDTSEYIISVSTGNTHINEGLSRGGGVSTITLNNLASDIPNAYRGQVIFIAAGVGQDQKGIVVAYDESTKIATMEQPWETQPTSGSMYAVLPEGVQLLTDIAEIMFSFDATGAYGDESGSVVDQIVDNAGGGDATEAKQDIIIASVADGQGIGFVEGTHSQVSILERGNVAWLTGEGSTPSDMYTDITTIPWQEVYHEIGNVSNEYYRENLYTANDTPIISDKLKIGKRVRE